MPNKNIVFFSEARRELAKEVQYHPKLVELLQPYGQDQYAEVIAEIAAYCGIVVDGFFLSDDLDELASKLVHIMRRKRMTIIN